VVNSNDEPIEDLEEHLEVEDDLNKDLDLGNSRSIRLLMMHSQRQQTTFRLWQRG